MPDTHPSPHPEPDRVLRRLGPYRILEPIGAGSFGRVYRAEDERIDRVVALKVLRTDEGGREIQRVFRVEQAALGLMNSDYIAKLYETGEADGFLYFALEHVEGEPITTYCDTRRLPLTQRLELFERLCIGVQHAHQRGVIHRDLKPNNVLVSAAGGVPVPKVIDFGLARGRDRMLFAEQLPTIPGQVMGTFLYMSPEQARGGAVDTRSDVHALGVMLYELLTGLLPVDPERLREVGLVEALRTLQENAVRRPSERLARTWREAPARAEAIAAARATTVPPLLGTLIGDLDWIVLQATAEDVERRYATAEALRLDVRSYLHHLPVTARPPSRGYRIRKFVRRHRWPVAVATASTAALIAVAVGALIGLTQARRNARLAEENSVLARAEANAERARVTASAGALFQAGEFAAQRGAYDTALARYTEAERSGHADAVLLAIRRVEALEGARRYAEAIALVETLPGRADLGIHVAKVEILRADLGVDRLHDPGRNLDHARRALALAEANQGALSAADVAYARMLLASDAGEALAHLRAARAADPYHRRTNDCLGLTLALLGHMDEARNFEGILRTLYPDDPQGLLYSLCLAAIEDDQDEVGRLVEEVRRRFGSGEARIARLVASGVGTKVWGNRMIRENAVGEEDLLRSGKVVLTLLTRLLPLAGQIQDALETDGSAMLGVTLMRLPPAVVATYRPVWESVLGAGRRGMRFDAIAEALGKAAAASPEATVPFLHAMARTGMACDVTAAHAVRRALQLPSSILEPRTLLCSGLALAGAILRARTLDATEDAALRADTAGWLAAYLAHEDLTSDELRHAFLVASELRSPLLPELIARWARVDPEGTCARLAQSHWLLSVGAEARARALFDATPLATDASAAVRAWHAAVRARLGR